VEWFETEEMALITDTIRDISAQEIEGRVVDLESLEKPEFPRAAIDTFGDLGFLWGPAPEGIGSDMNDITTVVILSKLAETSAGFAAIVASHYAAVRAMLALPGGFSLLKGACDEDGARGGTLPLQGITLERDIRLCKGSSDATEYVAIPAPENVDYAVLFRGRGPDAAMAFARGEGLSRFKGEKINLSGCDEMPASRLDLPAGAFESLEMVASGPDASRAREAMMSSLKLYYSAIMQGAARAATAYALGYAQRRRQTGRAILFHQNVYKKLVEMEVKNQSMTSFLYRAACNGAGDGAFDLRDMLYAFTKAESEYVVSEAVQSLGGYGYTREYGIEKKLRDIKTLQALLPTCLTDWLGTRGGC
jgi:alkylation response protein AidB-like acyl-CoA dehydrogenase